MERAQGSDNQATVVLKVINLPLETEEVKLGRLDVVVGGGDNTGGVKPVHFVRILGIKNNIGLFLTIIPHRHLDLGKHANKLAVYVRLTMFNVRVTVYITDS